MEYMPEDFSVQYPTTRAILDAAQIIPIQKPSNVESRSATWSTYKLFNTLRLNRVYFKGSMSFISDANGFYKRSSNYQKI